MKNFFEINRALVAKKKLFLLIPATLIALAVNAVETAVAPGTNAIQAAVAAASANDVLVLSTGTYTENGDFSINKNITIQAAENAHPVIAQKYYIKIEGGAAVTFKGIKFDGNAYGASDYCLRAHGSSTGAEIVTLDNCEFTGYPSYIIYTQNDTRRWDAIIIRNCYFHNNANYAVVINSGTTHQSCNSLTIENTTFAGFTGSNDVIYYAAPDAEHTTSLTMDHCTFYNHPRYAISWQKSTNLNVTNCIFAQPSSVSAKSIDCAGGTITNCLSYNSGGYSSAATRTGNLTGNPYFVNTNPDNYDFSVASVSPAHAAGTDDENLGDIYHWTSDDSAHPTTINISAGTDAIKAAVEAAWPGDEIVLATGTYDESASIALNKDITIKAADGATPTVVPVNGFAVSNGAEVTIQNIKFDATSMTGNLISVSDATAGNELTLTGCELYNTGSYKAIYAGSSAHLDACVINNCYFHNGNNSAIHIDQGSTFHVCDRTEITNTTFANYSGFGTALIQIASNGGTLADNQEIVVDHCTFYNFTKTTDNTYGFIDSRKSSNVTISNCIMANPTAQASLPSGTYNPKASQTYGGTVTNCLIYNVPNHRTTPTNPVEADPLFTDAANGDLTLKRNYITGEISPAYKAGTEGSTIGDPRWETTATYPETDFAAPDYIFTAAKAKLSAGTTILETNESAPIHPYIRYTHSSPTGNAEWVIKATRACYVQVTVNMADNTWTTDPSDSEMFKNHKHIFVVEVRDANETLIGSVKECEYNEDGSSDGVATYPTVNLPGYIYIPEAGVYTVKLRNPRNSSRCGVGSVTISYMGGEAQTITNTADFETDINDAWFSPSGIRADGKISFSGDAVASEWVRWNVTVANSDYYDITINSDVASGHIYSVTFYDGETQVARAAESEWHNTTGAIALGRRFLPAGDYVMEVKNSVSSNSDAKIVSVEAVAFVAPVIALPNTLPASSAITSELAYEEGGELYFTPSDKRGHILDQWAKWKVSVASAGAYLFTMNVTSTNVQTYQITILDSENNVLEQYYSNPDGNGDKTIKHYFNLAAGNYFVMVQNKTNHSDGHLVSLVVSQPSIVTLDEAAATDAVIIANNRTTEPINVQIIRTITSGMYNTFCLPFDLDLNEFKGIFGEDAELKEMVSAEVEDDFVLNLNFSDATSVYRCKPYLIKTSRNIVNPAFADVTIKADEADKYVTVGTNANFVSKLYTAVIPASPSNLFLTTNDRLVFPETDKQILGFRAYFVVHDAPAGAIKHARIVQGGQVATEIDLVEVQNTDKAIKTIENGQLVIIRDGIRYSVMGIMIK